MLALCASKVLCKVLLTRYSSVFGSHRRPKAFSKASQASTGSQICGTVLSIKDEIGFGRRLVESLGPNALSAVIDWIPTIRSREASGAKSKEKLLGMNLDESYPPRVRLPKTCLSPAIEVSFVESHSMSTYCSGPLLYNRTKGWE